MLEAVAGKRNPLHAQQTGKQLPPPQLLATQLHTIKPTWQYPKAKGELALSWQPNPNAGGATVYGATELLQTVLLARTGSLLTRIYCRILQL